MFRSVFIAAITALVASVTLVGCGSDNKSSGAAANSAASNTLLPSDPALANLYQQTCMACHTRPGSGAPQTGNAEDWAPRVAQGMDTLFDHTVNGYRGMPPLGSCMDCGEEDFEALISFMITGE